MTPATSEELLVALYKAVKQDLADLHAAVMQMPLSVQDDISDALQRIADKREIKDG